ncbi:MAG: Fic family protein [Wenzhouxiangellaceae bacterium]
MTELAPLQNLSPTRFDSPKLLKALAGASRHLAELKGVAASIPHQAILINTLGIQEAKDSSEIENIVTTHDELFKDDAFPEIRNPAAKEVLRYRQALWTGLSNVRESGLITNRHILTIQAELEFNQAGFRKLPRTELRDNAGNTVYVPPQGAGEIERLMRDLERFINQSDDFGADPLIKMALIHHQFESIHPFYDGNGRTGRLLNVLYLVKEGLLDIPVLYLSRYIVRNKADYYRLLQEVRTDDRWEEWVAYMLEAVRSTAIDAIATIHAVQQAILEAKHQIRARHKFYSQDLINSLFTHPYSKIKFIERDLSVSRLTATRYLDALVEDGFLEKQRVGRSNYYINRNLYRILTGGVRQ